MNAFPPRKLVADGIYSLVPHPIYFGFVLQCLGVSLYAGSAGGAFLTTPLVAVGAAALAAGHENIRLQERFGRLPSPALGSKRLLLPILKVLGLASLGQFLLRRVEVLANSWKSCRLGPVRIMNHFWFSGLAGGLGAFLVVLVSGREHVGTVSWMMLAGLVGAALVGQALVGKQGSLSRPFGYFGGVLGIIAAGWVLSFHTGGVLLVLTAFCLAGPWVQAIGRLRCIVQGCCHGMPAPRSRGIVVNNPHSRVLSLAGFGGIPIYPTQLYSILGNLFLGLLLVRLWRAQASMTLISGLYLTLAGAVRFFEEGYRGEPMTRVVAGLRLYQWFAVGMYAAGMVAMMFDAPPVPPVDFASLPAAFLAGGVFFLVCGLALSADFPESRARFSRLSG